LEENMWKPVVALTAAIAIAGSSIVYAQQRSGGSEGDGSRFEHRQHLTPEDRAAFVDARIAALKAGLELTADQAKSWPAFEQALRDMAKLRAERRAAREARAQNPSQAPAAPFDRLAQRADNMAKASAILKRIAETGQPLYMSLNDAQKERFKKLAHMLRPHHHMHGRFEERGQGWRDGQGYGRGDDERGGRFEHHGQRSGRDDDWQGGRIQRMSQEQL
jgi:LTXXQ motif family protein